MSDEESSTDIGDLDIVVAHWHIKSWGGAEYLVTKMAEVLDVNRIYTIGSPTSNDPNPYGDVEFYDVTDDLSLALLRKLQSKVGRVFEYALWEDVDWREYGHPDVLITSGATTRAVITPDDTFHLNYCHSPARWFYDLYHDRKGSWTGIVGRPLVRYLRMRDQTVDPRVDQYLVNSPIVRRRLWKYYKRESDVLSPPVDLGKYHNAEDGGYYLHLGRLDEEKGVPAVVEAFDGADARLILAGGRGDVADGVLRTIERAGNIEWRGFVDESEKVDLLARCRAVVFNGRNEDFGIVPIEANASGKPVLTRAEGFPGVFVEEGENGLVHDGTPGGIRQVVDQFERTAFQTGAIREGIDAYSEERFSERLSSLVFRYYDELVNVGDRTEG